MSRIWAVCGIICAAVSFGSSNGAYAFRGGPLPGLTGSPASGGNDCSACHDGLGFAGSVQILGVPPHYEPNAIYNLTIRISDATQLGGGFQLSAETAAGQHVGTLIAMDAVNTQINFSDAGFIQHTSTGVNNAVANWASLGSAAEYNIQWQAPPGEVGPVTFWAAGNAINNNFSFSGDHIYTTSETAGVPIPAASSWALLVLAILVMTAGTLVTARRLQPTV